MKGSFKLASIAGIPIKVHWSFGLLLFWLLYIAYATGFHLPSVGWLALFILALFICVVMHEYGHALTARHYGVTTRDIILSPIGGIARLERLPDKPLQELLIALAGPLVNVGICLLILPYFLIYSFDGVWEIVEMTAGRRRLSLADFSINFLPILFLLNILLAGFNLLPAFPMDGGRVFRALLSIRLGRRRATRIAALLGQILAVAFMAYGFFGGSFINIFIGLFVFFTASQEYRMVRMESILEEHRVGDLLRRQFTILRTDDAMQLAIEGVQSGVERNFLVSDAEGKISGVLHEAFIMEAIKKGAAQAPVAEYQSPKFEPVSPEDSLRSVFYKMQEKGYSILPVYREEELLGVIDVSMMNNFLRVQQKLK